MRTARDQHIPHSYLRGLTGKPKWTDNDRTLAVALTLHEDGLHRCGHPRSLAFEDFNEGMFRMHEETCQACAVKERYEKARGDKPHLPGESAAVVWAAGGESFRFWSGPAVEADSGQGDSHDPDQHPLVGDMARGDATNHGEPEQG